MRDLSVHKAIDSMQCSFRGCENCIFRITHHAKAGCVEVRGASALYHVQELGRIFGCDSSRIIQILNHELTEIDPGDGSHSYYRMDLDQIRELVSIGKPLTDRIPELFTDQWKNHLDEKWKETVEKEFELYIQRSEKHPGWVSIPIIHDTFYAWRFLENALEKGYEIETGRYGFRERFLESYWENV